MMTEDVIPILSVAERLEGVEDVSSQRQQPPLSLQALAAAVTSPSSSSTVTLSKTAQKKAARKEAKKLKREAAIARALREYASSSAWTTLATSNTYTTTAAHPLPVRVGGGKAARARRARNGETNVGQSTDHRPSGGAPIVVGASETAVATTLCQGDARSPINNQLDAIVEKLEALEQRTRLQHCPHLVSRIVVPTDNHGSMIVLPSPAAAAEPSLSLPQQPSEHARTVVPVYPPSSTDDCENNINCVHTVFPLVMDGAVCSLADCNLRSFTLSLLDAPSVAASLTTLKHLDLSRNELWDLPNDLAPLSNLTKLDLSRNWFRDLPIALQQLPSLEALYASHNMLRATSTSLQLPILQQLVYLRHLDLSFNQKCHKQAWADRLARELSQVPTIVTTISYPPPPGAFCGASAADRDPTVLRSQLEPWSTTTLRRRLVADFGKAVLPLETHPRALVMERLLQVYEEERCRSCRCKQRQQKCSSDGDGDGAVVDESLASSSSLSSTGRVQVRVEGRLVNEAICTTLLTELRRWATRFEGGNQERTSVRAEHYMILASPGEYTVGSKKAAKAAAKLAKHQVLWDLARDAIHSVDPSFSLQYTALAVTHNFQGSPHIDKQNVGPFYGLSLGHFDNGTGGIQVECSARVVATVNTKNRLGKVDGRYPHWVAPYNTNQERYSLIYYQTAGTAQAVGPAVFEMPSM